MNNWLFFLSVLAIAVASTWITYSSLKHSPVGVAAFIGMALVSAAIWMFTVRGMTSANQILVVGFTADIIAKAAGIGLPLLLFGAKADPKSLVGLAMMVIGLLIAR
jgi:drug/metabolite transporter (DMT)-like permease